MIEKLENLRKEIDKINVNLLDLLNKRTELVQEISTLKDGLNSEYFDPVREKQMLDNIIGQNRGPLQNESVRTIFYNIFRTSLNIMGSVKEKRLLVGAGSDIAFERINEMFDLPINSKVIIAGPCAVEEFEQLDQIAQLIKSKGLKFLRGGAYKPRTSPYDFQGKRENGVRMLYEVGRKYDLKTVTEVVDTRDVELVSKHVDILQIGARNMTNFELLKEVGKINKPVILKRGMNAKIDEFIFAAEYIALQGNRKIILCERGIRTFETKTRNTLDISSIPILKKETNLPVIVDLSHSLGRKDIINDVAKAVVAVGAEGIMVEVHPYPHLALSDAEQQLNPEEFLSLLKLI
ncbi:MAG TPA: bifunctional 3-deoxy-7-phosphoheptulonate synthase/chorismate mutase [Clostridia bacterium]|nr:bifunctional 3-deoxy-7-phosphoheptulonate synthase/chorismate mutase [Clostridia bacterium]